MNIKQSNKKIPMKSFPPWERPLFLIIMTFVGGYMNAYTYITRNKILANMHTANMSKLGINIALGEFRYALHFFAPIISCMLGVVFSNWIRHIVTKNKLENSCFIIRIHWIILYWFNSFIYSRLFSYKFSFFFYGISTILI